MKSVESPLVTKYWQGLSAMLWLLWLKIAQDCVKNGPSDIVSACCLQGLFAQNRFPHLPNKILRRRIFWRICGAASQPLSCLFWAGKVTTRVFLSKKGRRTAACDSKTGSTMKLIWNFIPILISFIILITMNMITITILIFTRFMMTDRFRVGGLALTLANCNPCAQAANAQLASTLFFVLSLASLWLVLELH